MLSFLLENMQLFSLFYIEKEHISDPKSLKKILEGKPHIPCPCKSH